MPLPLDPQIKMRHASDRFRPVLFVWHGLCRGGDLSRRSSLEFWVVMHSGRIRRHDATRTLQVRESVFTIGDEYRTEATMRLQHTIRAVIRPGGESGFVAKCIEVAVVTQGGTLDETIANLREAIELHLVDENPSEPWLAAYPTVVVGAHLTK